MGITWTGTQRTHVDQLLHAHPATTHRCAHAARLVLPIATQLDASARPRMIEPDQRIAPRARYIDAVREWTHHVTVEVVLHHVDALTGTDGHSVAGYLAKFFPDTHDALAVRDVDLSRSDL